MGLISRVSSRTYRDSRSMQRFGHVLIKRSQIFYETKTAFACVNISPLVDGHVLVCPKREVKRYKDLTDTEITEIFTSAKIISSKLEEHFQKTACTFGIQDGLDAGQSVEHVHLHVIPRIKGDFKNKKDIYKELQSDKAKMASGERVLRSMAAMEEEAEVFRRLFEEPDTSNITTEQ